VVDIDSDVPKEMRIMTDTAQVLPGTIEVTGSLHITDATAHPGWKIAEALRELKLRLNTLDGEFALQMPGKPYWYVDKAVLATLTEVFTESGHIPADSWAETVLEESVDSGETLEYVYRQIAGQPTAMKWGRFGDLAVE
jgi:hypothetical protein